MFLPLGDFPNPRGRPWVTQALVALNVAVYLLFTLPQGGRPADPHDPLLLEYLRAVGGHLGRSELRAFAEQVSAWDLSVFRWGFRPSDPSPATLFTSLFMHAGALHLAGNMLFLWIYGDNVEARLGRLGYLLAYLGTGVAATLANMLLAPHSPLPTIGASGAISGVLGFYFLWFPRNRVRVLLLLFPFLIDVVVIPARIVLGIYLIADNLLPLLLESGRGGGGVAYGAHIGGFLAGLGLAALLVRRGSPDAQDPATGRPAPSGGVVSGPEAAAAAWLALDAAGARGALTARELFDLGRELERRLRPELALQLYERLLVLQPGGRVAAAAHLAAAHVELDALGRPEAARRHVRDALSADDSPSIADAAQRQLRRIDEVSRRLVRPRRPREG
ncbi:MAG: rhomboid family intramembrane serine protease [Planctomycetes bacterium]|nr:rhomboid family intramembrane serine protease [Planctomycetota bacterium]